MRRGPTGTDRRTLSVATGDYVADRSAGYENQALKMISNESIQAVKVRVSNALTSNARNTGSLRLPDGLVMPTPARCSGRRSNEIPMKKH